MASLAEADEARIVYAIADTLRELAETSSEESFQKLYALARGEQVVRYADTLATELSRLGDLTAARAVVYARRLIHESTDREPLKLGALLVGLFGDVSDVEDLIVIGRHEEFTLFSALGAARLVTDPVKLWWRMARGVRGWGKVHLVERICDVLEETEGYDDVRAWLLREGCDNEVLPEYLACRCAVGGRLHEALAGSAPDEALLDGASLIIESLLSEDGPGESMSDYEHGAEAVRRLLHHLERACCDLRRLSTVAALHRWLVGIEGGDDDRRQVLEALGFTPHRRAEMVAACRGILERDEWKARVREGYASTEPADQRMAWSVAADVGVDLWENAFARLERNPLDDVLYYELLQTDDLYRQRRVMAFAERNLPLAQIASGPDTEAGFGDAWKPHQCLTFVLQELRRPGLFSASLVTAGLRSPVVRVRNMAASALEAQPTEAWGEEIGPVLEGAAREEPNEKLRERLAALLSRL
jgi:hypothetical protein